MTPFGIRKKLMSLIGGGKSAPAKPREVKPGWPVTFVTTDGTEFQAEAKQFDSLVYASNRGPKPIATGCADGTCATCQVEVLAGGDQLSAPDEQEAATKKANGVDDGLRLGCQTAVLGPGVKVRIINVLGEMPAE